MKRKKFLSVMERNESILASLKDIKADHPLWGYRRCWAYLYYRQHIIVNKKRIYRLMKENGLLVTNINKYRAKRKVSRPKPKAFYPNHIWGKDMWYYLVIVLGWYTKEIIGYTLSLQSKSKDWQEALHQAVKKRFPESIRDSLTGLLYLVSDHGCQPTSPSYIKACATLGIKQVFTSWSNPQGNADTERVIRTSKEDLVWPYDWDNPFDFQRAIDKWVDNYNQDFPHQTLGYHTPCEYYQKYGKNKELVLT